MAGSGRPNKRKNPSRRTPSWQRAARVQRHLDEVRRLRNEDLQLHGAPPPPTLSGSSTWGSTNSVTSDVSSDNLARASSTSYESKDSLGPETPQSPSPNEENSYTTEWTADQSARLSSKHRLGGDDDVKDVQAGRRRKTRPNHSSHSSFSDALWQDLLSDFDDDICETPSTIDEGATPGTPSFQCATPDPILENDRWTSTNDTSGPPSCSEGDRACDRGSLRWLLFRA